jgi:non-ribosomal peptide synthase protein (TIGR01720 family)
VRYGVVRGPAADRVLCVTHHLVSDWISHRILLEDIDRAYATELATEIALPPAVTELDEWVQAARRATRESAKRGTVGAAWARIVRESRALPAVAEAGRYGEVAVKMRVLTAEETTRLRRLTAEGPGSRVRDAVLAAIVRANREVFGREAAAIQLEGHGRDGLGDGVDVSRTVGWFTSLYPCVFRDGADEDANAAMVRIAKTLAELPEPTDSYGRLRAYGEAGEIPSARTEIGFNYLGEFAAGRPGGVFVLADQLPGAAIAADFARDHPLDVSAWIVGGALHVQCAYLPRQRSEAEMDRWMDRVSAFLVQVADARA